MTIIKYKGHTHTLGFEIASGNRSSPTWSQSTAASKTEPTNTKTNPYITLCNNTVLFIGSEVI